MLPGFEADGHLKLARVIFPRVVRGSALDPEILIGSLQSSRFQSHFCFTGHGVAFGARALLRAWGD